MRNLVDYEVVYCDSITGLQRIREQGLSANAVIRTSAPEVAFSGEPGVVPLMKHIDSARLYRYMESGGELSLSVFRRLKESEHLKPYALLVARTVHRVHQNIVKFITLKDPDFQEPRLVISVDAGDPSINKILNPAWMEFLSENKSAEERVIEVKNVRKEWNLEPFRYRLARKRYTRDELIWALGQRLGLFRKRSVRKTAMIVIGGNLVFDVAGFLAFSGFRIDRFIRSFKELSIMMANAEPLAIDKQIVETINSEVFKDFNVFLSNWVNSSAHSGAIKILRDELSLDLGRFTTAVPEWNLHIENRCPNIVFARSPMTPELTALAESCRNYGVPVIVGQHGISREYEDTYSRCRSIVLENSVSDLFLSYNPQSVVESDASVYKYGRTWPVGLSSDYYRVPRFALRNRMTPILYVSTGLFSGNFNQLKGGYTDIDRAEFELKMIESVLSRLPSRVLYKEYHFGTARYPESALIRRKIEKYSNIDIFDEPVELVDFSLRRFSLIVTSRATSTFGWCLMSNKPLVVIDLPYDCPFKENLKDLLSKSVFFFSESDPDLVEKLINLCSRSFKDIEKQWKAKYKARQNFLDQYVRGPGKDTGKRGADYIRRYCKNEL